MPEFIEMEVTSSSSGSGNNGLVKKVVKQEYELRAFTTGSISHWWVILPILSYLIVIIGGVMTSISVGNVVAAFDNYCIFNATFTLKNIDSVLNKTLDANNVNLDSWGDKNDCLFTEYASATCVIFGLVWITMTLQCGRGGASRRGFRLPDAWRIVPPTCVCNLAFFMISCFVLARVSSGFTGFCDNIRYDPIPKDNRNLSCVEILEFHFPQDKYNINLLEEYRVSYIGAFVQFAGCLLGFLIVTTRCCIGADFEIYKRDQIGYYRANTEDPGPSRKHYIPTDDDTDDMTKSTATTVICHNPAMQMDEGDEYGSLTSESELIYKGSKKP